MLYERTLEDVTLKQIHEEVQDDLSVWTGDLAELEIDVRDNDAPVIQLPGRGEIPFGFGAQASLANRVKMPASFYNRIPGELRQSNLSTLLNATGDQVSISFNQHGVMDVNDPKKAVINPSQMTEVIMEKFPEESQVVDFVLTQDTFLLDVLYGDQNNQLYVGGDPQVGDITRGGIRFGYDRKAQTKPWLAPYLYRLVCTNGMETPEMSLRLTSEGKTADDYLLALGNFTDSALGIIHSRIEAFYALRNVQIDSEPSLALARLAGAHGLPDSTVKRLINHLPVSEHDSVFDLINIVTNEANNPAIEARPSQRQKLQRAGGSVVVHQSGFCNNCGSCV